MISLLPNSRPQDLQAERIGLFLDFDGTLVELAERPDGVIADRALTDLLAGLAGRLSNRLAIVSGRSLAQLDLILHRVGIAMAGSHGEEIRYLGEAAASVRRPAALDLVEGCLVNAFGETDGIVIETKTLGVAIHYRLNPSSRDAVHALAEKLGADHALEVQLGKMMVELRPTGHDKGTAISAMMQVAPFAGHQPVFLGDDVTDEAGFAACKALGGAGILIGPERPSAALYRLDSVADARAWLAAL